MARQEGLEVDQAGDGARRFDLVGLVFLCQLIHQRQAHTDDVIDSRTPHYNLPPTGKNPRFCTYVSMAPAADLTQDELRTKAETFEKGHGTSHWPQGFQVIHPGVIPVQRDGVDCPHNTWKASKAPELSEVGLKLTGRPYIQQEA
jgi:hypothetical protein